MNVRKVIRKKISRNEDGTQVEADINAVVAANVNESGSRSTVSSRQRIVQKQGTRREDQDESDGRR